MIDFWVNKRPPCKVDHEKHIELLLGGGGAKGPGHFGLIQALEERKVSIGMVTGVSIGSCVAALWTNGYKPAQMLEIMHHGMARLNPLNPDRTLLSRGPFSVSVGVDRFINLYQLYSEIQSQYKIKPNPRLRIMAYNILRREPVVFEGTDYDLPMALAASCAIPGIMSPIWMGEKDKSGWLDLIHAWWHNHGDQLLIDGGVTSFDPEYFCNRPAIISRIGFARQRPRTGEKLTLFVRLWHMAEMFLGRLLERKQDRDDTHISVPVGIPDSCAINFGLPIERSREMMEYGYRNACVILDKALARGMLPVEG